MASGRVRPAPQAGALPSAVGWLRLGSVIVGIGFVLYLIYAEVVEIGRISPYCTSVHIITFLFFCLIVFQAAVRGVRA